MQHIELPTDLVKEALDCVVPYLAVSNTNRSNSISEHDFSRKFIESLVEELEAADLSCDHSVGICACMPLGVLNELKLRLEGKMTCPQCGGEGYLPEQVPDHMMPDLLPCPTCDAKGVVTTT